MLDNHFSNNYADFNGLKAYITGQEFSLAQNILGLSDGKSGYHEQPCPACGGSIIREAYMGGNVYFCPNCQPI